MTILERLGRGLMLAIATPIMLAEEVLSTRDDVAHERERRAKAEGERDEARHALYEEHVACYRMAAEADRDAQRISDLSAEVERLREVERNGLADDEVYQHTAATLQDRTRERDALLNASAGHAAEVNTLRARVRDLEEQLDAMTASRDEWKDNNAKARARLADLEAQGARDDVERCAYCLAPTEANCNSVSANVDLDGRPDYCGPELMLCRRCWDDNYIQGPDVRRRVALRAASCPTRRTSQDPLAVVCTLGCGADVGQTCGDRKAYLSSMPL